MSEAGQETTRTPIKHKRVRRTRAQIDADNKTESESKAEAPLTRARPRNGVEAPDGEILTRRARRDGFVDDFEIPQRYKMPGWDYEWKTFRIMGQESDSSEMTTIFEGGWRPVPPDKMPDLCPPGWDKKTIDRKGMRLFTRPMSFTQEAMNEDRSRAEKQQGDKLRSALAGPSELTKHTNRVLDPGTSITGEVGLHEQQRRR